MKLVKTANGKTTVKMSRKEWEDMGKKAGWMKQAGLLPMEIRAQEISTFEALSDLQDYFPHASACKDERLAAKYLEKGTFYLITNLGHPLYLFHPGTNQGCGQYSVVSDPEHLEWCSRIVKEEKGEQEGVKWVEELGEV